MQEKDWYKGETNVKERDRSAGEKHFCSRKSKVNFKGTAGSW